MIMRRHLIWVVAVWIHIGNANEEIEVQDCNVNVAEQPRDCSLTEQQLSHYNQHGWLHLPGVFSAEFIHRLRPQVNASAKEQILADEVLRDKICFGNKASGEDPNIITKLEMLRDVAEFKDLYSLCHDTCISSVAKQLLGPNVELMKDKFIFKAAGQGHGFTPHQDMQYVFHRFVEEAVSFYIAFDNADDENGGLQFAQGLYPALKGKMIVNYTEAPIPNEIADTLTWETPQVSVGDVIAFSSWTPHRSSSNYSPRDRSVYYPTWAISGMNSDEQLYNLYYEYYWQWIRLGTNAEKDNPYLDSLLGDDKLRPSLHNVRGALPSPTATQTL
eukprot:m.77290 g.77290  ORF g.77290 m.77290 type:complete len:330 (+) comp12614_c0_seq1:910-1899(+)